MTDLRFVVDERAFDLGSVTDVEESASLRDMAGLLIALREQQRLVGVVAGWGAIECRPGTDLASLLTTGDAVDRDVRRLLLSLLDKCVEWDRSSQVWIEPSTTVASKTWESFGVGWAHYNVGRRIGVAVVTARHTGHRGALGVRASSIDRLVHFIVAPDDVPVFLRSIFDLEQVSEGDFFGLAVDAFPRLCFAAGLDFRRFEGSYGELRSPVVRNLAALNDGWHVAYVQEGGNSSRISSRLGISVSIEGGTRASERLMRERDVIYDGVTYRCEWHAKVEPHRNRIHFHPGDRYTDGRILIGIFVRHLPT